VNVGRNGFVKSTPGIATPGPAPCRQAASASAAAAVTARLAAARTANIGAGRIHGRSGQPGTDFLNLLFSPKSF
jgi:hypothetical protein